VTSAASHAIKCLLGQSCVAPQKCWKSSKAIKAIKAITYRK